MSETEQIRGAEARNNAGSTVTVVPAESARCQCGHTREAHDHRRAPGCSLCQCAGFVAVDTETAVSCRGRIAFAPNAPAAEGVEIAANTLFRRATHRIMQRMIDDERFCHLMAGTDCYGGLLEALAVLKGVELPGEATLMSPIDVWELIHRCQKKAVTRGVK